MFLVNLKEKHWILSYFRCYTKLKINNVEIYKSSGYWHEFAKNSLEQPKIWWIDLAVAYETSAQ